MSWLKRRHDMLNETIQLLKTELYLNDIVLTSEIGQRISSVYDRTLMAAELYKERLEALTQSSRSQIWRVQSGQDPVTPTPVPLMSLDLGCDTWAPKRMKPNHAEGYTHDAITNTHQQLINNRNKKKKNKQNKKTVPAANATVVPKAIASVPKSITSVPKSFASVPYTIPSVPNTIATVPKVAGYAANGIIVPAANDSTSAAKAIPAIKPTATPKTNAFEAAFTASALEAITSAINTAYAAKATAINTSATKATVSATNTTGFAAKATAATTKVATFTKATPATKTTDVAKVTGVTKAAGVTKATGVTKAKGKKKGGYKKPFVAKAIASAVKPILSAAQATALTEQERRKNIVKNFIPKWIPTDQGQISSTLAVNEPALVQVKPEPNDIIQNTPSFLSVDMSQIKLQFSASDRITFKSESNPLEWVGNINSALDVKPAPVDEDDMMIDDLADHL